MVEFSRKLIDDKKLIEEASNSFYECAKNIQLENKSDFKDFFEGYSIESLKTQVFKIQYTKYYDSEFLSFDCSSEFHFEVHIHVYAMDEDDDPVQLANYRIILNESIEIIDDFLI